MVDRDNRREEEANNARAQASDKEENARTLTGVVEDVMTTFAAPLAGDGQTAKEVEEQRVENDAEAR